MKENTLEIDWILSLFDKLVDSKQPITICYIHARVPHSGMTF